MRTKILVFTLLLIIAFVFSVDSGLGKEKAQDFELVDIKGTKFSLSEHLGKVVLLDFFATWCGPCIMQIEELQTLYSDYSSEQLVILSISVDSSDSPSKLQLFAQQNQMNWTVAQDTDNVGYKYGVSPIPHIVVVDTEGYERYSHIGLTAELTLCSEIDAIISVNQNGDSSDSDASQTEADHILLAVAGICGIAFVIIVIIAAKRVRRSQNLSKKASLADPEVQKNANEYYRYKDLAKLFHSTLEFLSIFWLLDYQIVTYHRK